VSTRVEASSPFKKRRSTEATDNAVAFANGLCRIGAESRGLSGPGGRYGPPLTNSDCLRLAILGLTFLVQVATVYVVHHGDREILHFEAEHRLGT